MKCYAVDCRVGEPDITPFAVAWCTDAGAGYFTNWDEWRDHAVQYAQQGYTMVSHDAEQAVTLLLYQHHENVKCFYRQQVYTYAEWFYDCAHNPMPIWDARPLCGNMPLAELEVAVGLEVLTTPQRYTWQYRKRWALPCFEHGVKCCPACWGLIERGNWNCKTHAAVECDHCWKVNHARAVQLYMSRYSSMAEGYGIKPSRTIGGMALKLWRHLDAPEPIRLADREQDDFCRMGYRAGRTEPFKLGDTGPVTYGDINQMYATVLRDITLPAVSDLRWYEGTDAVRAVSELSGMADVTVTVPQMYIPPLGIISNDHYVFPVGTFRGHFSHSELRMAELHGAHIDTVHRALAGPPTVQPFSGYAAGLMDWRLELQRNHDPLEIAVKQMLNSLYGMIGMRAWHETEYVMPMPPGTTMKDWPYHDIKVLRDHVLMRRQDFSYRRTKYANPLWAALITADARIRLYSYMLECGSEIVYCDTDSIITMGELPASSTDPGKLRQIGFFDSSYILAPKLYRLQDHTGKQITAHAGIPRWQLDRLIQQGHAVRKSPVGVLEGFHTGLEAGRWITLPVHKRYDVGKRQPVKPLGLLSSDDWTDTRPLVMHVQPGATVDLTDSATV